MSTCDVVKIDILAHVKMGVSMVSMDIEVIGKSSLCVALPADEARKLMEEIQAALEELKKMEAA